MKTQTVSKANVSQGSAQRVSGPAQSTLAPVRHDNGNGNGHSHAPAQSAAPAVKAEVKGPVQSTLAAVHVQSASTSKVPVHIQRKQEEVPTINGKKMPPVNIGRRGRTSDGTKRQVYGIFKCTYANWTQFARFIANGQYSNVFEDDDQPSIETRMYWLTKTDPVTMTESWVRTMTTAEAESYDLGQYESLRVAMNLDESLPRIAYHEQFRNLGPDYADFNKYMGYVCAFKSDIPKVQKNIREFVGMNPEFDDIFEELPVYESVYNVNADKLQPINNENWVEA